MKRVITLLMALCVSLLAELDWATDSAAAFEQAKQEQKMVMVMLSQENCDTCWYMENVVFDNDDLVYELQSSFVPVKIDIHDEIVPEGLTYIGTPTFYFLSETGEKIDRLMGGANVKDFTEALREIKQAVKK